MGRLMTLGVPGGGRPPTLTDAFDALDSRWTSGDLSTATNLSVGSGVLTITPTLGNNLLADPGLETWASATDLTSWTEAKGGTSSINRDGAQQRGGTYCARLDIDASNSFATISQTVAPTANVWHRQQAYIKGTAGKVANLAWANIPAGKRPTLTADYVLHVQTGVSDGTVNTCSFGRLDAISTSIYYDDCAAYKLTDVNSLVALRNYAVNAAVSVEITKPVGTNAAAAGVILYVDANNYVVLFTSQIAAVDKLVLGKRVGGTYSVVTSANYTPSNGAAVMLERSGNSYNGYFGGVKLISAQAITDAVFTSARYWGPFSTYEGITFDNVVFAPKA